MTGNRYQVQLNLNEYGSSLIQQRSRKIQEKKEVIAMDNRALKKLEADLWESADLLRAGSKLTSNQYCMPVLGLLFLRYAVSV